MAFSEFQEGLSEYPLKRKLIFKGLSVRPSIGYPDDYFCRLKRTIILSGPSSRPAMPQPTASQPSAPNLLSWSSLISISFPVTILYSHSTMVMGDCEGALFCSRIRTRERCARFHQSSSRTHREVLDLSLCKRPCLDIIGENHRMSMGV